MPDRIAQAGVWLHEIAAQLKKSAPVIKGEMGNSCTYDFPRSANKNRSASHDDVSRTYSFNDLDDVVKGQTIVRTKPRIEVGVVFHRDEAGNLCPQNSFPNGRHSRSTAIRSVRYR